MRRIGEVASASHTHLPIKSNWLALCAAQVVHEDGAQHNAANRKLSTRAGACAHALARTLLRMCVCARSGCPPPSEAFISSRPATTMPGALVQVCECGPQT